MRGKASFANRLFALFIFLLVLGGYLGFQLVPTLTQGQGNAITPFKTTNDEKSCSDLIDSLKDTGKVYGFYSILGSPLALKDIEDPERTVYLALDVEREYRDSEVGALQDFHDAGGAIIIADNGEKSNGLSEKLDIYYRVAYKIHPDPDPYHSNGTSDEPIKVNATLGQKDYILAFYHPAEMDIIPFTFAITPPNIVPQLDQIAPNFAIMINRTIERGPIVFLSDAHLFTNEMFHAGGGNGSVGDNGQFLLDLIELALPSGGKLLFDESRHPGTPFLGLGQGALEAMVILTSNWNESVLMVLGLGMVLVAMVARTRGKEEWAHRHNPNRRALRAYLPETGRDAKVLLRDSLLTKVRMANKLSEEELDLMPPDELEALVHDKALSRLLSDDCPDLSKEEILSMMRRIERWG